MEEKNENQKKTDNGSINLLLTPEIYDAILGDKRSKILELKKSQCSELEIITKRVEKLNNMKNSLRMLKRSIRVSKRALRREKRKLKNINHSLEIENYEMINLNKNFISEEKKYIKMRSFETENMTK